MDSRPNVTPTTAIKGTWDLSFDNNVNRVSLGVCRDHNCWSNTTILNWDFRHSLLRIRSLAGSLPLCLQAALVQVVSLPCMMWPSPLCGTKYKLNYISQRNLTLQANGASVEKVRIRFIEREKVEKTLCCANFATKRLSTPH